MGSQRVDTTGHEHAQLAETSSCIGPVDKSLPRLLSADGSDLLCQNISTLLPGSALALK